jgi:Mg2+ and Co2+ transporter CorA
MWCCRHKLSERTTSLLCVEGQVTGMDVLTVCDVGVERHDVAELPQLLERQDVVIWVDIPVCDQVSIDVLAGVFGFHRIAVRDCAERNHVSKVHVYPDHVFTVLHAPQLGKRGHVHYIELDQFIGRNYLVTVHGPLNPAVSPGVASADTGAVLRRIEEKKLRISSPFELSHWIVSALIRRESDLVASLAKESGELEQRVMLGEDLEDPEEFLEELFQAWYRLLAVRTMATHSSATYGRMARLVRFLPDTAPPLFADIADGRWAAGVPARCHRVLPDPHRHPHDHGGGEVRVDRGAAERGDAPDHRLGRDRRRSHCCDRLLRSERALSRLRDLGRRHRFGADHRRPGRGSVHRVQAKGMAVATTRPVLIIAEMPWDHVRRCASSGVFARSVLSARDR